MQISEHATSKSKDADCQTQRGRKYDQMDSSRKRTQPDKHEPESQAPYDSTDDDGFNCGHRPHGHCHMSDAASTFEKQNSWVQVVGNTHLAWLNGAAVSMTAERTVSETGGDREQLPGCERGKEKGAHRKSKQSEVSQARSRMETHPTDGPTR